MRIRVTGASALHLRQDLHSGPMRTTTLARDGLYRWRGMDAGHRGRAVAIEVGMQVGIQVLFAGLVIFTLVMALVLSLYRWQIAQLSEICHLNTVQRVPSSR